ncbi:MAG: hypothetical protein ACETWB_03570, partial [Anaerolineae bacterium]
MIVPQLAKWRDNRISLSEVPHALEMRISNVEPDLYQMPTGCPRKGCQGMTLKFFTRSGTITRFWLSF